MGAGRSWLQGEIRASIPQCSFLKPSQPLSCFSLVPSWKARNCKESSVPRIQQQRRQGCVGDRPAVTLRASVEK